MTEPVWTRLGVPSVVNAAGKMTYLGSSALHGSVTDAIASAGASFVDMADLKAAVGKEIAARLRVPSACVVASAAAGIVQSVAGAITGGDITAIESVPHVATARKDVVICKAHAVHFGAPLTQMIALGGGVVREVGSVNRCSSGEFAGAMSDTSAAVVYVVSHHASAGAPELGEVVAVSKKRGVPVIVDAAAETDFTRFVSQGADLVVYSGHKAAGGPTSGLVVGSPELVSACAAQEVGVGRAMKVSKETLAGLLVAIEEYLAGIGARRPGELDEVLEAVRRALGNKVPIRVDRVIDGTRAIPRLRLTMQSGCTITAAGLVTALERGEPSIRTRNHGLKRGSIDIDPRELSLADAALVGRRIREIFHELGSGA